MSKQPEIFDTTYNLQRYDMNRWFTVFSSQRRKEIEEMLDMFSAARPAAKYRIRKSRQFKEGYHYEDQTLGQLRHQAKQYKREATWKRNAEAKD